MRRLEGLNFPIERDLFAFRCDSDVGQYAALRAGFGIACVNSGWPDATSWCRFCPVHSASNWTLGWSCTRILKSSRRMRLMFDHLVAQLRTYVASENIVSARARAGAHASGYQQHLATCLAVVDVLMRSCCLGERKGTIDVRFELAAFVHLQ